MTNFNEMISLHNAKATTPEAKKLIKIYAESVRRELEKKNKELAAEGKPPLKYWVICVPKWILHIPATQRELNGERVDKIKANFDPALMQVKTACLVGDIVELADGEHTLFGSPYPFMFVRFFLDSTDKEVAYLLAHQHDNTVRINGVVMYRCNLFCGNRREVEIDKFLASRKVTVKFCTKKPVKRNINAIAKVLQVYDKFGIKGVELMVDLIIDAGWDTFDAGFNTLYLEIGRTLCQFAEKGDDNYNIVRDSMIAAENPDAWAGMAREMYPSNSGQHGEKPIVDYVRYLCGLI